MLTQREALTVGVQGLSVRRADGEDARDEDVLEARNEEERRVLVIERFEFLVVHVRFSVPIIGVSVATVDLKARRTMAVVEPR
jgi:hypothetical protein